MELERNNDYRIGNWVLVPYQYEVLIPSIPMQIDSIDFYGSQFVFGKDPTRPPMTWSHKHIAPVRITNEILDAFGFINEWTNGGWLKWQKGSFKLLDRQLSYPIIHKSPILYVHKLQNLYYELMDKELQLKEGKKITMDHLSSGSDVPFIPSSKSSDL